MGGFITSLSSGFGFLVWDSLLWAACFDSVLIHCFQIPGFALHFLIPDLAFLVLDSWSWLQSSDSWFGGPGFHSLETFQSIVIALQMLLIEFHLLYMNVIEAYLILHGSCTAPIDVLTFFQ